MKKLIFCTFLILISCKGNKKEILIEKNIICSNVIEPKERIYIELISYYPALNKNQSNFYVVKNIHNNDTLYVINNLPIYDFIKNYKGANNATITLEKDNLKLNQKGYIVNIPRNYNINNKKIYLARLINLIY
ncbi:hypothetical protein N6B72_17015 [Chryseobacterium soli]|uniref:hypothetical protein n=1 Tax=Chryseobacterium soli TaxID=445961 RepID=UPI002954CE79|nr:hypothetical protein [Chryseobacterium soli]MDV7698628.1 hypothetical protein [Chryseobacterium soli]